MPTAPNNYAILARVIFPSGCWTEVWGLNLARTPQRGVAHFVMVIYAILGSMQPWTATVASGKFYEVYSLAVSTRISHNYQVLLDNGNRIIIPQGNFKVLIRGLEVYRYVCCSCAPHF